MGRKFWFNLVACAVILTMPLANVAAQNQPAAVASASPGVLTSALGQRGGKLSFRLAALADSAALSTASAEVQAQALSLPASGAGTLIKDPQGRMLVDIRLSLVTDANLAALSAAGAKVTNVANAYHIATALVAAASLRSLAQLQAVENITEELAPMHGSPDAPLPAAPSGPRAPAVISCPQGAAISGGDAQLNADQARTTYSVDGTGVKVGILSDSYDANASAPTDAATDIASGDLPGIGNPCGQTTPVHVISETLSPGTATDEGRAMVQIVHDVAPTATLAFASAHNGLYQFAANIQNLRTDGAGVIADDVFYFVEPFFQDGPVSTAIRDVTASGVVYLTSAGNSNRIIGGHNVTSYEAPAYRSTAIPAYLVPTGNESCHNFSPTGGTDPTYGVTLNSGGSVLLALNWAQPWSGVTTDLDIFVTNSANAVVAFANTTNTGVTGSQVPFEFVSWSNGLGIAQTYNIHVCRFTGLGGDSATPRLKWVMFRSPGLTSVEYPVSNNGDIVGPTIVGHSASPYSLSVAATIFSDNNNPETFSSFGPATHYFGPVNGNNPAPAITPQLLQQPDFTASDGGCTTFFGQFDGGLNCWRFFGTSAAAPHAAGVVALLKQKINQNHLLPMDQGTAKLLLQLSARSMSGGVTNQVGAGLIDALGAIANELLFVHNLFLPLIRH